MLESDELKQILGIFREEAREISERMTSDLLALETADSESAANLVDSLLRSAHTLKGGAGSLGIEDVAELAHVAETLLGQCRRAERAFQPAFADALLGALDEVARRLEALAAGRAEASAGVRSAHSRIQRLIAGEVAADGGATPAAEAAPSVERAEPGTQSFVKVETERIEGFSAAIDEFLVSRLRVAHQGRESGRVAAEMESLARRMRAGWSAEQHRDLDRIAREARSLGRDLSLESQHLGAMLDDLRESLKSLQVVPASFVLDPFRRSVRDHARKVGKDVGLDVIGGSITADRRILEGVRGVLIHLLRNAVDHGLEAPKERVKAGKAERGRLRVEVSVTGSQLEIAVVDDGRGLDPDAIRRSAVEKGLISQAEAGRLGDDAALALIWRSGFSTAGTITDTSGRGVGLDAVRDSITALGGRIEARGIPGAGSTFRIRVPLMLAAALGLMVEAQGLPYLIPIAAVERVTRIDLASLRRIGGVPVLELGDRAHVVVPLAAALAGTPAPLDANDRALVVLVGDDKESVAFVVDQVLGELEMSVRPLGVELERYDHLAGAARTGDGGVVLVLSVSGLLRRATQVGRSVEDVRATDTRTVLVVDDAVTSRLLYRGVLEAAGYRVALAADGEEALTLVQSRSVDAVVSDVRMPRMDGLELTRRLRKMSGMAELPVLLVTSLASDEDRREGLLAGATAYLVKGEAGPDEILEVLRGFLD